jgi:VanZ family protein
MSSNPTRQKRRIALRVPVLVLVLAFTAIPTELRRVDAATMVKAFDSYLNVPDVVANVLGYIPVGFVLGDRGRWLAVGASAAMSVLAEATQLFTKGRSPSVIDVLTNIVGAAVGMAIYARWAAPRIRIAANPMVAVLAAVLALGTFLIVAARMTPGRLQQMVKLTLIARPWGPVNDRGATTPGKLEAYWTFDRVHENAVTDDSGNDLNGTLVNKPMLVPGVDGQALGLNGRNQWLDVGNPIALRFTGSMTISAWINAQAFPRDDAAIVSDQSGLGYQLDTTIDEGSRTVSFKLTNAFGTLMARYGRTPLETNRWYQVAGVYDGSARTIDVYLNGKLDNGCVSGLVTSRQYISGTDAFVGRRGGQRRFEFAGAIDDVRIYSRALSPREVAEQVEQTRGKALLPISLGDVSSIDEGDQPGTSGPCSSRHLIGAQVAGVVVAFGMLIAVAFAGVWRLGGFRAIGLTLSVASAFVLLPALAPMVPVSFQWCVPLLTLAGGASVLFSTTEERVT